METGESYAEGAESTRAIIVLSSTTVSIDIWIFSGSLTIYGHIRWHLQFFRTVLIHSQVAGHVWQYQGMCGSTRACTQVPNGMIRLAVKGKRKN